MDGVDDERRLLVLYEVADALLCDDLLALARPACQFALQVVQHGGNGIVGRIGRWRVRQDD